MYLCCQALAACADTVLGLALVALRHEDLARGIPLHQGLLEVGQVSGRSLRGKAGVGAC